MFMGTLAGLVAKYILDKKFIFYHIPTDKKDDVKKFALYSLMGVFTTIIFWGTEIAFDALSQNPNAKYLIHGYVNKWDACTPEKQVAHVLHCLKKIEVPTQEELNKLAKKSEDYEYGKLQKTDLEDFRTFVSTLGMDWSEEGKAIPNLIDDKTLTV